MLRFDHMPSDFQPMFLFLGNTEDLVALAEVLRRFAQDPRDIDFRSAIPNTMGRAQLVLAPGEGEEAPYGVRPSDEVDGFIWVLNPWQAGEIAKRIDAVADPASRSGNDIIETGIPGEIPVKVSKGEFTDEFLTPRHYLDPGYTEPSEDA